MHTAVGRVVALTVAFGIYPSHLSPLLRVIPCQCVDDPYIVKTSQWAALGGVAATELKTRKKLQMTPLFGAQSRSRSPILVQIESSQVIIKHCSLALMAERKYVKICLC